jgi:glycerophosphoryl diester phosphodiesterase
MTVSELQDLDAGYWFRPNSYSHDMSIPPSDFPYRGIRTGAKTPPPGYTAEDFRIPTLQEVLDAFPTTPINIEIKMIKTTTGAGATGCTGTIPNYCDDEIASEDAATELADLLTTPPYSLRDDLIVVSFSDHLLDVFHAAAPNVALAPGVQDAALYIVAGLVPSPDVAAFQVPPNQSPAENIPETLINDRKAHEAGYAVHVWPNDSNGDTEAEYDRFLRLGVDGYMASKPLQVQAKAKKKHKKCKRKGKKKKRCKKKGRKKK